MIALLFFMSVIYRQIIQKVDILKKISVIKTFPFFFRK